MLCRKPPTPPAPDADGLELKIKLSGPTLVQVASAVTAALVSISSGVWIYIQQAPRPVKPAETVQETVEQP
ncbi:MAG: hypothetical protein AAFR99_06405 [Cyanobacteria bacterium J06629_9]